MKHRILIPMIALIMLVGLPSSGVARMVHDFDCNNCHKPGMDLVSVSGVVCLDCHTSGMVGSTFPLHRTGPGNTNPISNSTFAVGDASDALGSVTAQGETPSDQTSHNWAALLENSKAGADRPSNSLFYGRQNSSGSYVTCSRCHDPHGSLDATSRGPANPKLLKLGPDTEIAMCNDCHVSWASDSGTTEGGSAPTNVHPMITNYANVVTANPTKYNDVATLNAAAGEVALNATGGVDCMSCHGVHWTDSDSTTTDGAGQALSVADGRILKGNGAAVDQAGVAGVSICQSCHTYKDHSDGGSNALGCLVCHAAHLEDTGGTMNNYMLRTDFTTKDPNYAGNKTVSGLTFDLGDAQTMSQRLWNYCFDCHDSAAAAVAHDPGWTCSDCHTHEETDGSWSASGGCNSCHGYPPTENAVATGLNAGYASGYELESHFKDETATLHNLHAGGSPYSLNCTSCHAGNNHIDGTFDDVFLATSNQLYNGDGRLTGGNTPSYNSVGAGTCSSVYCHSNGGPRGATPDTALIADWEGGTVTGNCDVCHGNDATDMVTRNNSASHIAHLNKGYSCQVCHTDTADNATTLAAGAIGGTHVDGAADVAFDATSLGFGLGSTSYGTDGTCSVYCHSDSTTNATPDWDLAASGACGTCHQYSNAGVATGTGAALGGAHTIHLFAANGPQIGTCSTCHTHDGAPGAANSDHVNNVKDVDFNSCDACHGSDGVSTSGDDQIPVWTDATTVSCQTCHAGSVIAVIGGNGGGGSYVDKRAYPGYGHGDSGLSFEGTYGVATSSCEGCHDASASGHFNGNDDPRLKDQNAQSYAADNNAWCQECHTTMNPHFNTGGASTAATQCATCHDPHGQPGNTQDAMIVGTIGGKPVSGFADKTVAGSYFSNAANGSSEYEGICQVCHVSPDVAHYTRTVAPDGHNSGTLCISCHTHTTAPEAFKASCNGCHGDAGTGQYWPYGSGGSIPTANDEVGEHDVHVLAIGQRLGYGDFNVTMYTDAQQKAVCEYCHAATANDSDHGLVGGLDADVFVDSDSNRHAKFLDGTPDAGATYNNGADTCANVACHNNKTTLDDVYGWHDAANDPGCILCHNDMTNTGIATGQTHAAHTGADTTYGLTVNCATCHDAATDWVGKVKPANNHIDGNFDIGGTVTMTYDGSLPPGSSFGSCGTNDCHNDGQGGASVEELGDGYTWGTAEASACGICHSNTPTTNDHTVHLSGGYGPAIGTDCSACHQANANNTSMASQPTHINGTITFNNVATPASPYEVTSGQIANAGNDALDSCDLCHGGNVAANLAKDEWTTSNRVTCESCHGDYTAAVIGGVTAPSRAGSNYDVVGHGRTTGAAPNQACSDCHAESSAHISGSLGDANRLDIIGGFDYDTIGQRNSFCNDCHATAMPVHFVSGGSSTPGLYCVSCHDPHGQSGFDAMVDASVGGATVDAGTRSVAGFTDRAVRGSYSNPGAAFDGICQTCHTADVNYFNQSTDSDATHNSGANCISCHIHNGNTAFEASCNGCHGDATTGQYWPDGDTDTQINAANDDAGRHDEHVLLISQQLGYGNIAALLAHADTDSRQKTICAYCHAVNDDDHGLEANLPAEVFNATVATVATDVAKAIWDGSTDTDAVYTKASGTCATVDCHFNKTTTTTGPNDYSWMGSDTSNCVMCHVDVPTDTTSHTIHTNSGSWALACSECHVGNPTWVDAATQSAPTVNHINGTFLVTSTDRTFTYNQGTGSCAVNECHNDGNNNAADVSGYDWSAGATAGLCGACHGFTVDSNNHFVHANAHTTAGGTKQFVGTAIDCQGCHTNLGYFSGTSADHFDGSVSFKAGISYSANTAINDGGVFGSCDTLFCHSDGDGNIVTTPLWDRATATVDDCIICHEGASSGTSLTPAHEAHVDDAGATIGTTLGCVDCHSATVSDNTTVSTPANHINSTVNVISCATNDCHSDGNFGNLSYQNPTFATDSFDCTSCHGNGTDQSYPSYADGNSGSADSNSHNAHVGSSAISCEECHADTSTAGASIDGADGSQHVDGGIDVTFKQTGSYVDGTDTCSATYCHGAGTPVWGGAALNCDSCHDASNLLDDSHGAHYESATVATAINANNNSTSGAYIFQCGNCHNGTSHAGGNVSANQAAEVSLSGTGTYTAGGSVAGTDNGFNYTAGSCNTNDCHNDGTAAKGAPNSNPTWTVALAADCTGCHDNNAAAASSMASNAHAAHVNDGSIMSNASCNSCHNVTVDGTDRAIADKTQHIDGTQDVDIAGSLDSDANPANNFAAGSCNNVYCHSDGQSSPTYRSIAWNATISDCVSCHDGASGGSTLTGAHRAHTVNGATTIGRNLGCQDCHGATVSNNTTISTPAQHVDGGVDVISCATNVCHSNGNTGNLVYNNPTWSSSYACDSCHGDDPTNKSYPVYANGGVGDTDANSHVAHIVGGSLTCNECHAQTSTAGTSIDGTAPLQHVDATIDVSGAQFSSFSAGTCSSIACHGGNDADWGDTLGCSDCHSSATSDTDDFTYNNGTVALIALDEWNYSGHGVASGDTYDVTGRSGADFDTAAGSGDPCLYCHDSSVGHGAANYFRLRDNGFTYNTNPDLNGACRACHETGTTSYDPDGAGGLPAIDVTSTVKIDKFHGGGDHNTTDRDDGRWCWDCHDPHGDSDGLNQRIQMVQRNPQNNPDANGVPAALQGTDVLFYDNTLGVGAGGFARDAAAYGEGICNSCHTATDQYTQVSGKGTHPSSNCMDCHKHSENTTYDEFAFAGSGCNGCHGGSFDHSDNSLDNTNYWPDDLSGTGNAEDYDTGRHAKHIEALAAEVYSETLEELLDTANGDPDAKQKALCSYCHDTPGGANHLSGLPANVNSMYTIWDKSADNGSFDQGSTNTCATVDCHFNKTTTNVGPNDYSWYGSDTSNCVMCHVDVPTDTSSHTIHTNSGSWALACSECHVGNPTWVDAATQSAPTVNHINGTFLVTSTDRTFTYNQGTGSCGTNECHNDGNNNAADVSGYDWSAGVSAGLCSACHGFAVDSNNHPVHAYAHNTTGGTAQFVNLAIGCDDCHTNYGYFSGTSSDHFNGSVSFKAGISYSASTAITDGGVFGTCNTSLCHTDGLSNNVVTPAWDRASTTADDCRICHLDRSAGMTNAHDEHVGSNGASSYVAVPGNQSTAGEYRFDCGFCHGSTVSNHLNGSTQVSAASWNGTTCNNNACHSDGAGGAANLAANWTTGWVGEGDSDSCNNCHGNAPGSGAHSVHAIGIHADDDGNAGDGVEGIYSGSTGNLANSSSDPSAHGDGTTSTVINCQTCHFSTVTNWYNARNSTCAACHDTSNTSLGDNAMVVTDKSKHVDGTSDVVFQGIQFKSKAQVRDDLTTVPELDNNWTRTNGYKGTNSYDQAKTSLNADDYTDSTCTVSCHNGIDVTWTAPTGDCSACHTDLPQ